MSVRSNGAIAGFLALGALVVAGVAGVRPRPVVAEDAAPVTSSHVALGAPACGGTNKAARCHLQLDLADPAPRRDHYSQIQGPIRFRELAVWREHGGHARSFERLASERARTMADQLAFFEAGQKEPDPARKDPQRRADCLACHALRVGAPDDAARSVEGVSCESCHGNAGAGRAADGAFSPGWIDAHMQPGWRAKSRDEWASVGMTFLPDARTWARTCVECHLGTGEGSGRKISHELYAAGHPPLSFELVTDLALAPHHFRERAGAELVGAERVPWFDARLWALGQAVALGESMRGLEKALRAGPALDYSFMECFACHHAVDATATKRARAGWRQGERGFFARPGEPVLGLESWMVARHVARRLLPKESFDTLVADVVHVFDAASGRDVKDRAGAAAAARRAAAAADELAARAEALLHVDRADAAAEARSALELLREVAADGEVGFYGFRAAEQQAKAVYVLYLVAYGRSEYRPANDEKIRARLDELFGRLYSASRDPRPGDFELATFEQARAAFERELPAEPRRR